MTTCGFIASPCCSEVDAAAAGRSKSGVPLGDSTATVLPFFLLLKMLRACLARSRLLRRLAVCGAPCTDPGVAAEEDDSTASGLPKPEEAEPELTDVREAPRLALRLPKTMFMRHKNGVEKCRQGLLSQVSELRERSIPETS